MNKGNNGMTAAQKHLVTLCVVVYFISYLTRKNYSSVLANIEQSFGISETSASYALTGMAIFYGAGQLISGWLGDRVKPRLLIACGLFTAAAMNLLLPFCTYVPVLTAVWCVNGLAQAMMWPPIVKLLSASLSTDNYKKATVKVSYGSQAATVVIYLFGYASVRFSAWRMIFVIPAVCAAIMAVVVLLKAPDVENERRENVKDKREKDVGKNRVKLPYILLGSVMLVTVLQGIMRDGVSDWLPTYIGAEFGISPENAILMGIAPPVLSIVFYEITSFLSRKILRNEMLCGAAIFIVGFAASLALSLFSASYVALSVAMATLVTACMHGVNYILTCIVPQYFFKTGRVSFIAGLINSCTYIGSAISGYGFASLASVVGWSGTIVGWAVICGFAAIIFLLISRRWAIFKEEE